MDFNAMSPAELKKYFDERELLLRQEYRAQMRSAEAARIAAAAAVAARASKIAATVSQPNPKSKSLRASARAWSPHTHVPAHPKRRQPSYHRQCYGVDANALEVARKYMALYGNAARRITHRATLEASLRDAMESDYYTTFPSPDDLPFPAPNKILFALAHGMKLLRVRGGRTLEWNRFRDNHGNKLR